MDNILEDLNETIAKDQEMLSLLPKNTKKEKEEYAKKVVEVRNAYRKLRKEVAKEIQVRYHNVIRKNVSEEVKELGKTIKDYSDLEVLNEENSTYEKMSLDRIIYHLRHFYKSDLKLINEDILRCIQAFKQCNINLQASDFSYNQYTYLYMKTFFEEIDKDPINSDKIKNVFEEIYWKCSDIILYIELNVRYLYFKNKKEIDKYYRTERENLVASYKKKPQEIIDDFKALKEDYDNKYNGDEYVILKKFLTEQLDINRYSENEINDEYSKLIKKEKDKIKKDELDKINDNICKLADTLYEYKQFLKYKNIIDDMKKRNTANNKKEFTIEKDLKNLSVEENKLINMNKKIQKLAERSQKKSLFFRNSKAKLQEEIDKTKVQIDLLKDLYQKFDENLLNYEIVKMFNNNSSIYKMLLYASSHYQYFCKCLTKDKQEDEEEEIDKDKELSDLKEFLLNPQYNVVINNVKIGDEQKIEQIIKDRYYLFNLEIEEEDLKPENIDELLTVANKIVNYIYIKNSVLTVKDIKFICELKKICITKK